MVVIGFWYISNLNSLYHMLLTWGGGSKGTAFGKKVVTQKLGSNINNSQFVASLIIEEYKKPLQVQNYTFYT